MSSHFSPKSLLFYGTMIGSVAILFRIVSGYGEANLKAPPNVGGYYLSEQSLPGCPESTQLALLIQQSGVYLHGSLRLVERSSDAEAQSSSSLAEEDLTLGGLWEQQQLSLAGSAYLPATCSVLEAAATEANTQPEELQQIPVAIQGTVSDTDKPEFTGKVTLEGSEPWEFTAVREAATTRSSAAH